LGIDVGIRTVHGDVVGLSVAAKVQTEMLASKTVHAADVYV
jgi:hypothetical protein